LCRHCCLLAVVSIGTYYLPSTVSLHYKYQNHRSRTADRDQSSMDSETSSLPSSLTNTLRSIFSTVRAPPVLVQWWTKKNWVPSRWEDDASPGASDPYHPRNLVLSSGGGLAAANEERHGHHHRRSHRRQRRSLKRRIFLFLTEPDTSLGSAVFFAVLIVSITLMNLVMIMQTMSRYQFTPTDCRSCGGPTSYLFDDDDSILIVENSGIECVCPPEPIEWTGSFLRWCIYFFTVEWTLRVVTFEPSAEERSNSWCDFFWRQWFCGFLFSWSTILDALAIFPYYIEMDFSTNGLMSLRLLRLFRVFQLVRLGQYNDTFMSLTSVMTSSILYLKLFFGVLLFGAAIFGSLLYWLEKGDWKYFEQTKTYAFVRQTPNGKEEISPFDSIPSCFWWFFVTATTTGYGDMYPTSTPGKWVATITMLLGVLVIAFPVSVFSDLWQKELRKTGALPAILEDEDKDGASNDGSQGDADGDDDTEGFLRRGDGVEIPKSIDETSPLLRIDAAAHGNDSNNNTRKTGPSSAKPLAGAGRYDSDYMWIHKSDLAEILASVKTIEEERRRIERILRNYRQSTSI